MKCGICEERKARRHCLGLQTEICSLCCGNEREVSISCPFECEYLQEARRHEKPPALDPKAMPNPDVRVPESFLREHEDLVVFTGQAIFASAISVPGAVDSDAREALESLIRTKKTLQSGIYYESRPGNPLARAIYDGIRDRFEDHAKQRAESAAAPVRDSEILAMLVFFERVQLSYNNGRPKGRAFLDFLRGRLPEAELPKPAGSLIQAP
jgi:hypothetical protein